MERSNETGVTKSYVQAGRANLFQTNNYMSDVERNLSPDYDMSTLAGGGEAVADQRADNTEQIHRVEREWLERLQTEQARHRARERDSKNQLSRATNDLKSEQTMLQQEIKKSQIMKNSN